MEVGGTALRMLTDAVLQRIPGSFRLKVSPSTANQSKSIRNADTTESRPDHEPTTYTKDSLKTSLSRRERGTIETKATSASK